MCKKKEWNNRSGDKTKKHASKLPPPLLYNVHMLCFLFCWLISLCSLLFLCLCYLCLFAKGQESKRTSDREREYLHSAQGAEKQCSSIFLLYHACTAHITNIYIRRKRETEKKITSISPCIILLPFSNLNNWYTQVDETKWERERTMRSATTSQKSHFGVLYVYIL